MTNMSVPIQQVVEQLWNVRISYNYLRMQGAISRRCPICGEVKVIPVNYEDVWLSDELRVVEAAAGELDAHERRCPAKPVPDNIVLGEE